MWQVKHHGEQTHKHLFSNRKPISHFMLTEYDTVDNLSLAIQVINNNLTNVLRNIEGHV